MSEKKTTSDGAVDRKDGQEPALEEVRILIRRIASDLPLQVTVFPNSTSVASLKEIISIETDVAVAEQRLVHAGKIMHDQESLSAYGIKNGSSVHLVASTSSSQTSPTSPTIPLDLSPTRSNDDHMKQLLDSPFMRSLTSNPEIMRSVMMANPQVRAMIEENPEIGHVINDPAFLRQSMEMARNPNLMRESMRSNDRAISNLEMIPGGFNHLRRMYESMQGPLDSVGRGRNPSSDEANSEYARRYNVQDLQPGQINNSALPNPWQPATRPTLASSPTRTSPITPMTPGSAGGLRRHPFDFFGTPTPSQIPASQTNAGPNMGAFLQLQQLLRNGQAQSASPTSATSSSLLSSLLNPMQPPHLPQQQQQPSPNSEPPEVQFRTQLESLEEMGFGAKPANLRALQATGGNVQAAVDFLLRNS